MNGQSIVDVVDAQSHRPVARAVNELGAQDPGPEILPVLVRRRFEAYVTQFIYHDGSPNQSRKVLLEWICFPLAITTG